MKRYATEELATLSVELPVQSLVDAEVILKTLLLAVEVSERPWVSAGAKMLGGYETRVFPDA